MGVSVAIKGWGYVRPANIVVYMGMDGAVFKTDRITIVK
jgi:hypothetical protein